MTTNRITLKNLEAVVDRINNALDRPMTPWTKTTANIGNFHLYGAYGGYALHEMISEGGGVNDIFGGYMTKRELWEKMHAFLRGVNVSKSK